MKGIEIGYLKTSPFAALMLATMTQITSRMPRAMRRGIPTIMKHSGMSKMVYSNIEIWKLSADLPFMSTHSDWSFLDTQQINGPIIPPKGKKYPAKVDR